jgi:hypothetical protein
MKNFWFYLLPVPVAVAVAVAACIFYSLYSAPSYVTDAEERVGSYLGYSFGTTDCESEGSIDEKWILDCRVSGEVSDFKYMISPSPGNARGFYLTAMSHDARMSAKIDLMTYLDIRFKAVRGEKWSSSFRQLIEYRQGIRASDIP